MVLPFRSTSVQLVIVVKRSREHIFFYNWKDSKGQYPRHKQSVVISVVNASTKIDQPSTLRDVLGRL